MSKSFTYDYDDRTIYIRFIDGSRNEYTIQDDSRGAPFTMWVDAGLGYRTETNEHVSSDFLLRIANEILRHNCSFSVSVKKEAYNVIPKLDSESTLYYEFTANNGSSAILWWDDGRRHHEGPGCDGLKEVVSEVAEQIEKKLEALRT